MGHSASQTKARSRFNKILLVLQIFFVNKMDGYVEFFLLLAAAITAQYVDRYVLYSCQVSFAQAGFYHLHKSFFSIRLFSKTLRKLWVWLIICYRNDLCTFTQ